MSAAKNSRLKRIAAQLTGSIAFYPVIIAIAFLMSFWGMITLDDTDTGKNIKASWHWLRMKDAAAARLVASTIASGMLTFTVFSFSMVMIVLNQTASKMSNRILETIIRNRFQQIVLGCYIGTVTYSIFLITAIRDTDNGIYVPALSTYVLILFAIVDIFLFIYFLHFVTQYAKYQTIIHHIYSKTLQLLKNEAEDKRSLAITTYRFEQTVSPMQAGYFEGCDERALLSLSVEEGYRIHALYPIESFVLKGTPLLRIETNEAIDATVLEKISKAIDISGQPSFTYFLSGFNQLSEVAMKALSPGINDPATAVLSLQAMTDLFCWLLANPLYSSVVSDNGKKILNYCIPTTNELLENYLLPVWDYGKEDRTIQKTMADLAQQLLPKCSEQKTSAWLEHFLSEVKSQTAKQFQPLK
jgi:uncharacterized membrane protein